MKEMMPKSSNVKLEAQLTSAILIPGFNMVKSSPQNGGGNWSANEFLKWRVG
jgi:hypothetical protein